MRIVVSIHVPKTGGTSFRRVLESLYGDAFFADYEWLQRPECARGPQLRGSDSEILNQLEGVKCIHGHFNAAKYLRLREIAGIEPVFVTWLRDPIERAVSTYYFLRRLAVPNESPAPWHRAAKELSIERFFTETTFGENQQHKQLSALSLEDFSFVGCTERYEESLRIFCRLFDRGRTPDNVPHELKNEARVSAGYDISHDLRRILNSQNQLDFPLHQFSKGWISGASATLCTRESMDSPDASAVEAHSTPNGEQSI